MKANLTIYYSSKVFRHIEEDIELSELDKITTQYGDQKSLRLSDKYRDKFDDFYRSVFNYRSKIDNPFDKDGHLYITYYDDNNHLERLRVLYSKESEKTNPKRVKNAIIKKLRDEPNRDVLLGIYHKFDNMLISDYNLRIKRIGAYIRRLTNNPTFHDSEEYRKLIKVLSDELEARLLTREDLAYLYIRLIDEFMNNKGIKTTTNRKKKLVVNEDKITELEQFSLIKDFDPSKNTPKTVPLTRNRENFDIDDIKIIEEDYNSDIEIDDFSFEEKDDKDTWFK